MFFHWLYVTCTVWASLSYARPDESKDVWTGSRCDFVNHQMECIPCSVTGFGQNVDKPNPQKPRSPTKPRSPPEKPREVDAFLYKSEKGNVSSSLDYEGFTFIVKHPFTTVTLTGYFIEIDLSRKEGYNYVADPYKFTVDFRELHYDDPSIKVFHFLLI